MDNIITHDIAALPLYEAGVSAGTDIGLRLGLDAITAEMTRQDDAAAVAAASDPDSMTASRHEYAAGRLLAVGQIVAGRFRQAAS